MAVGKNSFEGKIIFHVLHNTKTKYIWNICKLTNGSQFLLLNKSKTEMCNSVAPIKIITNLLGKLSNGVSTNLLQCHTVRKFTQKVDLVDCYIHTIFLEQFWPQTNSYKTFKAMIDYAHILTHLSTKSEFKTLLEWLQFFQNINNENADISVVSTKVPVLQSSKFRNYGTCRGQWK